MRAEWIERRRGHANKSQMHYARKGLVTEEMAHVAARERLPPELVLREVARGRMIIPANVNHPELEPMCIGIASSCKINANIGNSQITSDVEGELVKLRNCLRHGADTVMDLSTGGDIPHIRNELLRKSTVPLGTVPPKSTRSASVVAGFFWRMPMSSRIMASKGARDPSLSCVAA